MSGQPRCLSSCWSRALLLGCTTRCQFNMLTGISSIWQSTVKGSGRSNPGMRHFILTQQVVGCSLPIRCLQISYLGQISSPGGNINNVNGPRHSGIKRDINIYNSDCTEFPPDRRHKRPREELEQFHLQDRDELGILYPVQPCLT